MGMGSGERTKKRSHLWKKAVIHFTLCFSMGFFTGFAPTGTRNNNTKTTPERGVLDSEFSPDLSEKEIVGSGSRYQNRSLAADQNPNALSPKRKRLVIIITPTTEVKANGRFRGVLLRRMASTLRLAPAPLLWIVVEKQSDSSEVCEILRKSGTMYRHLAYGEKNFAEGEAELDYQRNLALDHIQLHRLTGIVHFAALSDVYDLRFFDEIREIEVFGAWPMASVSTNRKRVRIEGPVCDPSDGVNVIGWHFLPTIKRQPHNSIPIRISSFAFNSSILWDPERWGRHSSLRDNFQKSIKFVKQTVVEDYNKLKGIPKGGCSKIMQWRWQFPTGTRSIQQYQNT